MCVGDKLPEPFSTQYFPPTKSAFRSVFYVWTPSTFKTITHQWHANDINNIN